MWKINVKCTKLQTLALNEPLLIFCNTQNLGCDVLTTLHEWFQTFRRIVLPLSSESSSISLLGLVKAGDVLLTQRPIDTSQKIRIFTDQIIKKQRYLNDI